MKSYKLLLFDVTKSWLDNDWSLFIYKRNKDGTLSPPAYGKGHFNGKNNVAELIGILGNRYSPIHAAWFHLLHSMYVNAVNLGKQEVKHRIDLDNPITGKESITIYIDVND